MLKITQIEPDILQLQAGYLKTFLIVLGIVLLSIIVLFVFSYQHISVKINRSENTVSLRSFSFFSGFQSRDFKLSEVQEMRPNISTEPTIVMGSGSGIYKVTYERPSLKMKNGEEVFLLKRSRSVFFTSKLFREFNHFLKHSKKSSLSKRVVYLGNLNGVFLGVLGFISLLMLVFVFFVRDVKIILDKKTNTYKTKYLSPIHKNKEGSLSDMQNVLLISEVSKSLGKKQAGLYLNLKNKEVILLKSLGFYDQEQVTEESLAPFRANGKKIANFLELEFVE